MLPLQPPLLLLGLHPLLWQPLLLQLMEDTSQRILPLTTATLSVSLKSRHHHHQSPHRTTRYTTSYPLSCQPYRLHNLVLILVTFLIGILRISSPVQFTTFSCYEKILLCHRIVCPQSGAEQTSYFAACCSLCNVPTYRDSVRRPNGSLFVNTGAFNESLVCQGPYKLIY